MFAFTLVMSAAFSFLFVRSAFSQASSNPVDVVVGEPKEGVGTAPVQVPDNLRQAVLNEFGIDMSPAFPESYFLWAWEHMWAVSNTRFGEYVRGTVVLVDNSGSHMSGCKTIHLRGSYGEELFKVVFTHEMGHVIDHCSAGGAGTFEEDHLFARNEEGPLTPYSTQLCYYSNPGAHEVRTEDFAETIAYYLNPQASAQTGCGSGPPPYADGSKPLHFKVAQDILGVYP